MVFESIVLPKLSDWVFEGVAKSLNKSVTSVRSMFRAGIKGYYQNLYNKHSTYRSIISLSDDLSLKDTYVDLEFSSASSGIYTNGKNLWKDMEPGNRYLIRGGGGYGKSLFTKMCLIWTIESKSNRIAHYLDLKDVGSSEKPDILQLLVDEITPLSKGLSEDYIAEILKSVDSLVILDGFDEVRDDCRNSVLKAIERFSEAHPRASIVVTSRPHDSEASWNKFNIYDIRQLNKEKAIDLISSFPYDDDVKNKLILDIHQYIWEKHESFLSVPLLCTMVIVVYSKDGFLLGSLSGFYQQTFEALLFRHDTTKNFFKRTFISELNTGDFDQFFSAFCFHAYSDLKYRFKSEELPEYINRAKSTLDLKVSTQSLIRDLVESTCLIVKEGNEYKFAHRSFQEYFSAKFAKNSNMDVVKVCEYFHKRSSDITLSLYYEINKDAVLENWLAKDFLLLPDREQIEKEMSERVIGFEIDFMPAGGMTFGTWPSGEGFCKGESIIAKFSHIMNDLSYMWFAGFSYPFVYSRLISHDKLANIIQFVDREEFKKELDGKGFEYTELESKIKFNIDQSEAYFGNTWAESVVYVESMVELIEGTFARELKLQRERSKLNSLLES